MTNLISFSNMITCAPITGLSIPILLTRTKPMQGHLVSVEKSFLSAFQEAKFDVYWISNQPAEPSTVRFIEETDHQQNLAGQDQFDEALLPLLSDALSDSTHDLMIVLHTLGSHYNYANRYPIKFNRFRPSTQEEHRNSKRIEDKLLILNSYDNSVLYSDWLISEVIDLVRRTNALATVVFISDHGEIIFDGGLDKLGHGIGTASRYAYKVPFFVWYSASFESRYSDLIERGRQNRDLPFSTENFFDSILDLNQISINGEDRSNSVFSDEVVLKTRKVLFREGELIEYDSIP